MGRVVVTEWKNTYPGLVDHDKLDALDPVEAADRWREIIDDLETGTFPAPRLKCAVDRNCGAVVGFALGGPARDVDAPAAHEVWSLYVDSSHHGSGVAAELLASVIEPAAREVYLWVATGNARAIAFYRKHGFHVDGQTRVDPGWNCHESRMRIRRQ
ncbi:Hypothetical protein BJL86_0067 [Dietzia timorensis]|uniref:N-acetyltransferase domain-containing protein n=2 Tax=Dietzia timorensis TaxID=499555 RepID=A0A173LH61_9ACTN|nr:Hypothetical protein BJL86_0067 [Dietzia timorensis]